MWLAVCAIITLRFPSPRLWPALGLGAVVGFMCGVLQARAIRANPAGYFAMMLVRELVSYPSLVWLRSR